MKVSKVVSLVLFLFISATVLGQKGPQALLDVDPLRAAPTASFYMGVTVNKTATSFNLVIQNPERNKLRLQIGSTSTGIVIDTVISSASYIQRYNMEQVEDGQYSIVVSNGKEKQVQKIELKTIMTRNVEVMK